MKWSKIWVQRSGTWLPLLFAVCKPPTIFQSSFAAAFQSLPFSPFFHFLGGLNFLFLPSPIFSVEATTAKAGFNMYFLLYNDSKLQRIC
jgi:hypothetical protein